MHTRTFPYGPCVCTCAIKHMCSCRIRNYNGETLGPREFSGSRMLEHHRSTAIQQQQRQQRGKPAARGPRLCTGLKLRDTTNPMPPCCLLKAISFPADSASAQLPRPIPINGNTPSTRERQQPDEISAKRFPNIAILWTPTIAYFDDLQVLSVFVLSIIS